MTMVDWNDAVLFCNWLSRREGLTPYYQRSGRNFSVPSLPDGQFAEWIATAGSDGYRLPTEAEWEYACRAGTVTDHSFGNDTRWAYQYAVYGLNRPEECGSRLPNGWGFFDVHGNVSEWCQDYWEPQLGFGGIKEISDPTGPEGQPDIMRVLRGGWFNIGTFLMVSGNRDSRPACVPSTVSGFRVARSVSP
jgi:formylglycine-generating enzyme required for sulfatase activity